MSFDFLNISFQETKKGLSFEEVSSVIDEIKFLNFKFKAETRLSKPSTSDYLTIKNSMGLPELKQGEYIVVTFKGMLPDNDHEDRNNVLSPIEGISFLSPYDYQTPEAIVKAILEAIVQWARHEIEELLEFKGVKPFHPHKVPATNIINEIAGIKNLPSTSFPYIPSHMQLNKPLGIYANMTSSFKKIINKLK